VGESKLNCWDWFGLIIEFFIIKIDKMEEQLITFETAKLAKEKGLCDYFENASSKTKYVMAFYSEDGETYKEVEFQLEDCVILDRYYRPTQSLLQKWLRDVHKIHVDIKEWELINWYFYIKDGRTSPVKDIRIKIDEDSKWKFDSYEEALEAGLQEALKLIKDELV